MTDKLFILVEVSNLEGEAAAVAAIENLTNAEQDFEVLETMTDDGGTPEQPIIYFP